MSIRIIFETHSTSVDNEAGLASGWFDAELSPKGMEQARALGERRRDEGVVAVHCSDLCRSYRTAEIAFNGRTVSIVRDPRLREVDYGKLTRAAAAKIESCRTSHIVEPFPGGESYQDAVGRVAGWLEDAGAKYRGRLLLVIGHRATFYALEHLTKHLSLEAVIAAPWHWQPGWRYDLSDPEP
jgi:2,3-bisphosphoglycerate-dependent phosphoglycerate mutase